MRQYESELQKLVYDEYGDELEKKDREIEKLDQEIEKRNKELEKLDQKIKECKSKTKQLSQIEDLNSPEAKKIIQSMPLL